MDQIKADNIDDYIAFFPASTQVLLKQMRQTIKKAAPAAVEKISYQMPTFALAGNLVHFAGYKNHIGFYPGSSGVKNFKEELEGYKNAKGSIQFPIDQPLPLDIVTRITQFRVQENLDKAAAKQGSSADIRKKAKPAQDDFLFLPAPAKRALVNKGITNLVQLSHFTEKEILSLHGMGPSSIPKIQQALVSTGLKFKD